jgi:hypothetical protein
MHSGILVGPIVSFLIGGFIAWIIYLFVRKRSLKVRRKVSWIVWFISCCAWLFYGSVVCYWNFIIEPRLDGTEGSGVGFGAVMIYLGGAIVALFFTGIAMLYGVLIHGKK